ncbi:Gfo/Idh/MocA family oxidoreductase [Actinomadura sp. 6K520]|uniref:Gfo/Idh/MocA family protein n=1 Tax=Actinomadura sp. 6K520 TaxID=2530364 RepID=UPI00140532B9|nr:Gfo/Idh/MocA family oxidoreductase [Actinomadura sp. 6K520]
MNVIVLGCGLIAGRWVRALVADARLTVIALVDPDPAAARRIAQRCGLNVPLFPTLEAAVPQLTHTDAAPQVVVNLAPADLHAATTRAALEYGYHVLTEKPLALTLKEAERLVSLARRRTLVLSVMSNRGLDSRFLSYCQAAHALGSGPYVATVEMLVHLPSPGFRSRLTYPALQDLAVHAFDQAQHLVTARAQTIACFETPLPRPGGHCSIATAHVRFADGSLLAFRGGFSGPGMRTPADGTWRIDLPDGHTCCWDGQQTVTTIRPCGQTTAAELTRASDGHAPRITQMIDALYGGPPPPDGLAPLALLDAAVRSAQNSAPTDIRQDPR